MRKVVLVLATMIILSLGAPINAQSQDCDESMLKGVEFYYCVSGSKEFKIGMEKTERKVCIEHKKLDVKGCEIELATEPYEQTIYIVAPIKMQDKIYKFEWQCDPDQRKTRGVIGSGGDFLGWMHPDYTLAKYPALDNSGREGKFINDLEKRGKFYKNVAGIVVPKKFVHEVVNQQTCQYYNKKTNKVFLRFVCNWKYGFEEEGGQRESEKQQQRTTPKPVGSQKPTTDKTTDVMKKLKGLFD